MQICRRGRSACVRPRAYKRPPERATTLRAESRALSQAALSAGESLCLCTVFEKIQSVCKSLKCQQFCEKWTRRIFFYVRNVGFSVILFDADMFRRRDRDLPKSGSRKTTRNERTMKSENWKNIKSPDVDTSDVRADILGLSRDGRRGGRRREPPPPRKKRRRRRNP